MKILLIEDNPDTCDLLKRNFEHEMFVVDIAMDGEYGSYAGRTNQYDVIISDYMLPLKNGLQICHEIRSANKKTPIIIISVRNEVPDKVALLDCGADDFLAKPFSFAELLARVKAVTRRPYDIKSNEMIIEDIVIDSARQNVNRNGQNIYLTRKEFMLLECFAKNKGRVVSRGQINENVWENENNPFSNTIEAHVRNLRKKLSKGNDDLIKTVPGRGYIIP
jgi:two-component system copper resistance phosphate regulon response regulator CusR